MFKVHDDFMTDVRVMIKNITDFERKGDYVNAAREHLKLANARVAYCEQFINELNVNTTYEHIYQDEYESALNYRANVRDFAAEYGVFED